MNRQGWQWAGLAPWRALALSGALALWSTAAQAQTSGDPALGKPLHDKQCMACHNALMKGDGNRLYSRPDRKVKSSGALMAQIKTCSVSVGTGWSAAEDAHVAAYLNTQFYQLKP